MEMTKDRAGVVTPPPELLARMGALMRGYIAPSATGQARTQAYMASVVLRKLALQLELTPGHEAAARAEGATLQQDLHDLLGSGNEALARAVGALGERGGSEPLCGLVEELYRARSALGEPLFDGALGRVRRALRADIDRRLEYAA